MDNEAPEEYSDMPTAQTGKTIEDYLQAAEQGDAEAQNKLGQMYEDGDGVAKSYEKAAEWYRKAAEQGNADAQERLGGMYSSGYGVAKSYEKAAEWYRKAAEQGNKAGENGGNYEKDGGGVYSNGGKFTMSGGEIKNNNAQNGGGIYVNQHASVVLRGAATVTGNTADVQGGGVYVRDSTATFIMSGEATVDTGNDVYLANALITVNDGALTGTAPVARITVTDTKYSNSTTVLTGTITAGTPPNQNYTKFTVTPQDLGGGTTQQWEVGSDGRLKMKP